MLQQKVEADPFLVATCVVLEFSTTNWALRRVEDITEALWGTRVSPSTVSDLNKKIYGMT
jgi:hypothetical protein